MRGPGVVGVGLLAVGFVAGLVVGGVGPRGELRAAREALAEAERQRPARSGMQRELVELVRQGLDGAADGAPAEERPARVVGTPSEAPAAPPGVVAEGAPAPDEDSLAVAREAIALRQAQARAALREDAAPTPEQEEAIDAALDAMNDQLIALAYEVVDDVRARGEPGRRATMAFVADALDILVAGEQDVLGVLSEDQRAAVREEATDPLAFLDPALIDVFAGLEDELERR